MTRDPFLRQSMIVNQLKQSSLLISNKSTLDKKQNSLDEKNQSKSPRKTNFYKVTGQQLNFGHQKQRSPVLFNKNLKIQKDTFKQHKIQTDAVNQISIHGSNIELPESIFKMQEKKTSQRKFIKKEPSFNIGSNSKVLKLPTISIPIAQRNS